MSSYHLALHLDDGNVHSLQGDESFQGLYVEAGVKLEQQLAKHFEVSLNVEPLSFIYSSRCFPLQLKHLGKKVGGACVKLIVAILVLDSCWMALREVAILWAERSSLNVSYIF